MSKINFVIKANGTTAEGFTQFIAETPESKLIATINPRFSLSGRYSNRFLNICFMDGSVEIADRGEGEFETEHAAEIISKYLGL
jgi:prepilin-type processing-associated H-X9-DG protein